MNLSKRALIAAGGALLTAGTSLFASGQTVTPVNSGLNVGSANVCPKGQTTPAPCSQTATVTFKFTAGGSIGKPAVLMLGAPNLDFTDAGTGTCTTGGVAHTYSTKDTCTVDVKFAPMHPGPRNGAVVLYDTASPANALATAYVYGMGTGPQVAFISNHIQQVVRGSLGYPAPLAVAIDGYGNVFMEGSANQLLEVFASGGYTTERSLATIVAWLHPCVWIQGIAVDGSGNVFFSCADGGAVQEVFAASGYTTVEVLSSAFSWPMGVAVDGSGNVFVAENGNSAVKEMLAAGGYTTTKTLATHIHGPAGVAVDGSGNVFVSEYGSVGEGPYSLKEILAADGSVKTLYTDAMYGMRNLALDASGNIFVLWAASAKEILAAGGYTNVLTVFSLNEQLEDMKVDASGNVYVAAFDKGKIYKLNFNNPPSLSFATTPVDATSSDSPLMVTIANDGNQDLNLLSIGYPPDFPEATGVSTDCPSSTTLAAGDFCTLSIDFSPLAGSLIGASTQLSETVGLATNNLNGSTVQQPVALSGTAIFPPPALTSPKPGNTLSSSQGTFSWRPGAIPTDYMLKLGTTHFGASDVFVGTTTSTSIPVTAIPKHGATLYATLSYKVDGTWIPINYTYKEAGSPTPPAMINPAGGSTLTGSTATFNWSPGAGPTSYLLKLATTHFGASDVFSGVTSGASMPVSGIPTNGVPLYAQLEYKVAGTWIPINYTYTEAGSPTPPAITDPAPGSTLAGQFVTFSWSPGAGPTNYVLKLGTTYPGSSDIFNGTTTSTSVSVSTIPKAGVTLFATLEYKVGGTWTAINYTYTEHGSWIHPSMVTPAPGSALTGPTVTFNWSPGAGPTEYRLRIGSTGPGSSDLYLGNATTALSAPVSGLPTNGKPVYVTLGFKVSEVWHAENYTYTAH